MGLNSLSTIKLVDLLCEGPVQGIIGGAQGIYLDETPLEDEGGNNNFEDNSWFYDYVTGTANQTRLIEKAPARKLNSTSVLTSINKEIGSNYSETLNAANTVIERDYGYGEVVHQITNSSKDETGDNNLINSIELIFTVPALFSTAKEGIAKGQLFNASVRIKIFIKDSNSGYGEAVWDKTVTGISTSNYQVKSPVINLEGDGPWFVKVVKRSSHSFNFRNKEKDFEISYSDFEEIPETTSLQDSRANRIFWTQLIERQDFTVNEARYNNSACVSLNLSTEEFQSLPTRAYLVEGLIIPTPHNAVVRSDGSLAFPSGSTFDGSLVDRWTTCPVCAFYAMATNSRWGAALPTSSFNWVDLYPLCQYANQLVDTPDGKEPRFAMNTVIGNRTSAFRVLKDLASVFRGMSYWSSNTIQLAADHGNLDGTNVAPVHLYNNSNVIGGAFNYSGTSLKTRSTSIRITYNDPKNFYKPNFVVEEDSALIAKYGYQTKEIAAFGCTSKYQAQRMARWLMKSEELDQHIVTFSTGLEGVAVFPGQVFAVADTLKQGTKLSGRISSATTTAITCDQTIVLPSGSNHQITCKLKNGNIETRDISSISGATVNCSAFSTAPLSESVWSLSASTVVEQKFRCVGVEEQDDGTCSITGVEFNDSIYAAADTNSEIIYEDITTFDDRPRKVSDLTVTFSEISVNNNTVNRASLNWSRSVNGSSVGFELQWRIGNGSYQQTIRTTNTGFDVDGIASGQVLTFRVWAVGGEPIVRRSPSTTISVRVPYPSSGGDDGPILLPPDPEEVTVQATSNDEVVLRWTIPQTWGGIHSDLIAVIRHSEKTDGTGTWPDSTLLRDVQATTDSVVLPLLNGEYMVKFKDTDGNKSVNEVTAIINLPDAIPRKELTVRREDTDSPPFQGQKDHVEYSSEYDALILSGTEYWDSQAGNIDSWSTIDFTGDRRRSGYYYFNNIVDLGGIYTLIIGRRVKNRGLLFDDTIDDKTDKIDKWSDIDGVLADETSARMFFRKSNGAISLDDLITEDGDKLLLEDGSKIEQENSIVFDAEWVPMERGRYTGRIFQFRVELSSKSTDQSPMLDELGYVLQMDRRIESLSTSSSAGATAITYSPAFYETPQLGITANNMATGDYYVISSESKTGFTIHFKDSSGSSLARSFSYQASGYGAEGS